MHGFPALILPIIFLVETTSFLYVEVYFLEARMISAYIMNNTIIIGYHYIHIHVLTLIWISLKFWEDCGYKNEYVNVKLLFSIFFKVIITLYVWHNLIKIGFIYLNKECQFCKLSPTLLHTEKGLVIYTLYTKLTYVRNRWDIT